MISKNNAKRIIILSALGMVLTLLMADFKYASKHGFWASLPYTQTIIFKGVKHEERVPYQCSGGAYKCYLVMKDGFHPEYQIETSYKYSIAYSTQSGLVILSLVMALGFIALFKHKDDLEHA